MSVAPGASLATSSAGCHLPPSLPGQGEGTAGLARLRSERPGALCAHGGAKDEKRGGHKSRIKIEGSALSLGGSSGRPGLRAAVCSENK